MKTKFNGILTLLFAFVVQLSFAQEKTVSGTVTDDSGGLPGVTVLIKGTKKGTDTDFDGKYTIKTKVGDVLVFSYLGYKSVEKTVGSANTIDVKMVTSTEVLEEVVVAFGKRKREAITGSVQVVSAELIENQQVTSPLRALQGNVAGVNMITQGGQPGTNPNFVIRGFGSFDGSNAPLIVVDGAPFSGNLNTISQDQIESMSVLKDAASASLYGSRASNGVVIITTKRGKRGSKAKVSIRSQYGISNPAVGIHDLVNSGEYLQLNWQALRNDNLYGAGQSPAVAGQNASNALIGLLGYNPYDAAVPVDADGNLTSNNLLWNTSWQDVILRNNVPRVNHNVSVSGGGESNNYFLSVDYLDEEGPVIVSDFERVALRATIDSDVNSWLKVGATASFSRSFSNNPDQTSGSTTQAISYIYNNSSIYPIYVRDENGQLILDSNGNRIFDLGNGNGRPAGQAINSIRPGINGENILASITLGSEERTRTNFLSSGYAEISFSDDLKFRTTFNYENYVFDSHSFDDDLIGAASNVGGRVSKSRSITSTINAIQALNYTKSFKKHNFAVDVIHEANTTMTNTFTASATGFLPGQEELGNGTIPESFGGIRLERRIASILGRVSYNFDNKYFLDVSLRRDRSSQFNPEYNTGDFYSFGGSWSLHKESFLADVDWLDNLRIRGSYGELGNINIPGGFFPVSVLFGSGGLSPVEGNLALLPPSLLIDPTTQWEKAETTNFGLDFGIFGGALSGTVEYFKRRSVDLIRQVPVAPSTGASGLLTNAGIIENRGLEVTLNSNIINKNDIQFSVGGNFTFLTNEIIQISEFSDREIAGSKLYVPGNSLFEFFIREWAGVDPATGDALWYQDITDASGNVTGRTVTNDYTAATRYETGKESIPDIQGGFNTSFRYKNFDFSTLFNFSFGGWLLDTDYSGLIANLDDTGSGIHPDNFLSWQQPGDITDFPRLTTSNNNFNSRSTRFLFRNDFVRLKSLTVGYNLPTTAIERYGLSKIRFYVQGDNLVTWQSHKGIDPEQSFNGLTANRSPLQRTLTFGTLIEF